MIARQACRRRRRDCTSDADGPKGPGAAAQNDLDTRPQKPGRSSMGRVCVRDQPQASRAAGEPGRIVPIRATKKSALAIAQEGGEGSPSLGTASREGCCNTYQ